MISPHSFNLHDRINSVFLSCDIDAQVTTKVGIFILTFVVSGAGINVPFFTLLISLEIVLCFILCHDVTSKNMLIFVFCAFLSLFCLQGVGDLAAFQ